METRGPYQQTGNEAATTATGQVAVDGKSVSEQRGDPQPQDLTESGHFLWPQRQHFALR